MQHLLEFPLCTVASLSCQTWLFTVLSVCFLLWTKFTDAPVSYLTTIFIYFFFNYCLLLSLPCIDKPLSCLVHLFSFQLLFFRHSELKIRHLNPLFSLNLTHYTLVSSMLSSIALLYWTLNLVFASFSSFFCMSFLYLHD